MISGLKSAENVDLRTYVLKRHNIAMSDPLDAGFKQPLESSPIELENWQHGAVEPEGEGVWHRVWHRDSGDLRYIVHYYQNFDRILFEIWKDDKLVDVPVEASINCQDEETEDFLQGVEGFFKLVEPQIE